MKISSYAYTALAFTSLATSAYAGCSTDKVNVEVCLKTDNYPHETKLTIDDDDDRTCLEMDGLSKSGKTYCEDVKLCPGRNWLKIEDDQCDGLGHSYGEITIRTRNGKIMDKTLSDFGCTYGWRSFVVPTEGSRNNGGGTRGGNGGGSGPFGTSNCRQCKDKCAKKYKGDSWDIKRCKTDRCRAHFGKKPCKD